MRIARDELEQYLDAELPAAQAAELERHVQTDPDTSELLAFLRRQRALRQTALAAYEPDASAATALAHEWLENFHDSAAAPLARIALRGYVISPRWVRRIGAAAAMVIIAAGSFFIGRVSSPTAAVGPNAIAGYTVQVHNANGDVVLSQSFKDLTTAKQFATMYAQQEVVIPQTDDAGIINEGTF